MIFDKHYKNDKYEIFFNSQTGLEIMRGINGNDDPFSLNLPSLLDIGIMGHCKHKCQFCYQGHGHDNNMTFEDYKTIIDQVKHHTNQVALGGRGDPNQHENFAEIVAYSRENGVVPNYTTSGIDLTDDHVEASKYCGAVAVSDYRQPYTYIALKKFMDAGVKTNIHMIFMKQLFSKIMSILNGKDPWGGQVDLERLNAVIFLLFKPAGAGANLDWRPTDEQLKEFSNTIFNSKCKFKIGMDSCLINYVTRYTIPTDLQRMSIDTCEGARMSAYITPNMKLMPCSFADKTKWALNIKESSIEDIWVDSTPFKTFRDMLRANQQGCPLHL